MSTAYIILFVYQEGLNFIIFFGNPGTPSSLMKRKWEQIPASVQIQRRMQDLTRLNGKTAVITGGATGIGLAAAKRFIEEGAFVFIFGRRQEALDAAVADLGPNARAVKGSVSDLADLDRLYAAVKAERGTLDI